jgi:hypothetical protein
MSTMNYDVATVGSRRLRANDLARSPVRSTLSASRDLTSVVVFSVIGLLASLCFALFFPDGLLAFFTQVP